MSTSNASKMRISAFRASLEKSNPPFRFLVLSRCAQEGKETRAVWARDKGADDRDDKVLVSPLQRRSLPV